MGPRSTAAVGLASILVVACGGCSLARRPSTTRGGPFGPIETGSASWYGPGLHGRRTAAGEVFDQNGLTAAHRRLPLGTRVRVTNLTNGRSVDVRINDRGPFARGRTIDLSYGAARALRLVGRGTAPVRIQVLRTATGRTGKSYRRRAVSVSSR